ncbi:peptide chain release factor N(5)-glutamine methyltransferase [candidate division KSB1 bacterium]|nr:MAG: peptide chain release factor N(5)-glutamine methyltransferase [candidate division KSB1 bacterium]
MNKEKWNIIKLINWSTEYFREKNFSNPRTNTELLLCHTLNMKRLDLYLNYDRPLSEKELALFKSLIKRRVKHEPIQYITNETEFMGLRFKVNKNVFIPRPETEILVEKIIEVAKEKWNNLLKVSILEVGTGSGNIAVSLAHFLPNAEILSMDISKEALDIARENSELNNTTFRTTFIEKSIFSLNKDSFRDVRILVSNPPYVSRTEFEALEPEVRDFEPKIAYFEGGDGLSFYRKICSVASSWISGDGCLFLEVGYGMQKKVIEIVEKNNLEIVNIFKDYNGIDRVVYAKNKNERIE